MHGPRQVGVGRSWRAASHFPHYTSITSTGLHLNPAWLLSLDQHHWDLKDDGKCLCSHWGAQAWLVPMRGFYGVGWAKAVVREAEFHKLIEGSSLPTSFSKMPCCAPWKAGLHKNDEFSLVLDVLRVYHLVPQD